MARVRAEVLLLLAYAFCAGKRVNQQYDKEKNELYPMVRIQ